MKERQKRAQKDMRVPRELWVIFDPMNGPEIFPSGKAAWAAYREWEKEAKANSPYDAYWDVPKPVRYVPLRDGDPESE